ncbi:putative MFS family arabinose efflux permease [Pseudomonas sp. URMO17WK12:I1]|uniref:MFS transporter n=1 Tax=unclassified Pseudomonas TaxID=196821 RepID=UPI0004899236|nr:MULTISPECIES: MFS transporter [unclassified Pseudomonas]PZW68781.1 putative MFS family arabinose efflux permease [Pseudomonas sp. URMO17WK12:I1]
MNTANQNLVRAACIFIAAASILVIGVQPIFIGLLTERLTLTLLQQSWTMSAEMCGSIVGTLLYVPMLRYLGPRTIALSTALVLLVANAATASVAQLDMLLVLRCISGICSGILYSYAIYCLGRMSGPDRSFGILLFVQTALFSSSAVILPMVAEWKGFSGAIYYLVAWFVLLCLVCFCLPTRQSEEDKVVSSEPMLSGLTLIGVCSLLGMLFLQLSIYSLWGFVEGIASEAGIAPVDIGWAISIGLLGGLPGAALPSIAGRHLGRMPMILLGSLAVLAAIYMFATRIHSATDMAIAVFLMNFGWNLALSYYMSSVVTHDPTGRLTKLVGVVQVASAAAAPTLLGLFIEGNDRFSIFVLSSGAILVGCVLVIIMLTFGRRNLHKPVSSLV